MLVTISAIDTTAASAEDARPSVLSATSEIAAFISSTEAEISDIASLSRAVPSATFLDSTSTSRQHIQYDLIYP